MNSHDNTAIACSTTDIAAEQVQFEAQDACVEELEVVELDAAPLTDINFGF